MKKEELIEKIVDIELRFFLAVEDIDGKQRCQENPESFVLARLSQWLVFGEDVLESYLCDLVEYLSKNKNIIAQKYALMMLISGDNTVKSNEKVLLPSSHQRIVAKQLVDMMISWYLELGEEKELLPQRPLYTKEDTMTKTSVETYLYGEYLTYSESTLIRMLNYFVLCQQKGINLVSRIIEFLDLPNQLRSN